LIRCDEQYLEKVSKTYVSDDLHSFCSPLTRRPWDSHRIVPKSLVNIITCPNLINRAASPMIGPHVLPCLSPGPRRIARAADRWSGVDGARRLEATTGRRWAAIAAQMKEAAN
jgi:hypothetical protein